MVYNLAACNRLQQDSICLVCRYLEGTPQATLSKRMSASTVIAAAGEMFRRCASCSATDVHAQSAIKCLLLQSEISARVQARLDTLQALRVATDDLSMVVDIAHWHALLFPTQSLLIAHRAGGASSASSLGECISPSGSAGSHPLPAPEASEMSTAAMEAAQHVLVAQAVEQLCAYPSSERAASATHLIALLFPVAAAPSRGSRSTYPTDKGQARTAAEVLLAGALAEHAATASDAAALCIQLAESGSSDGWPAAAHLCLHQASVLNASTLDTLTAYALRHGTASAMSRLLAWRRGAGAGALASPVGLGDDLGSDNRKGTTSAEVEALVKIAEVASVGGMGLESVVRGCWGAVRGSHWRSGPPTLGPAPQAVLASVGLLRTQGVGATTPLV
jgi:hypothetical protein